MKEPPRRLLVVSDRPGAADRVRELLAGAEHRFEVGQVAASENVEARIAAAEAVAVLLDSELTEEEEAAWLSSLAQRFGSVAFLVLTEGGTEAVVRAIRAGAQDALHLPAGEGGGVRRAIVAAVERQRREWKVRQARDRYALALRGAREAVWEWDLPADRVVYSSGWRRILGFGEEEIDDRPEEWLGRVHPADLDGLKRRISAYLTGRTDRLENEHRIRDARGRYRWVLCRGLAVRSEDGGVRRMVGSLTDIDSRKLREEQLLHDALHDGLTGIANSALLLDRLAVALAQAKRDGESEFALLFLDLDRFKRVNDNLGHGVGDRLLAGVALRLQTLLRPGDTVARLGGDEFAILAHGVGEPSDATRIAERIHEELRRPFEIDDHSVLTSTSIGIALSSAGYERPQEILRDADTAMYRAKNLGRSRHAIFDEEMHRQAVEFLEMESDLGRGIRDGQLEVRYQPIVSLRRGQLIGFEALVRWLHPRRGLLEPGEFMSVAEETGLVVPLGWAVLREACGQMATWHRLLPDAGELAVRVNLSGRQFEHPDLVSRLDTILAQTGLDPRRLGLEIPEGAIASGPEGALERLQAVRERGIDLHIDGFGTGRSSLAFLHELPAQTLEIDRSLVGWLTERQEASRFLTTVVLLAKNLGMKVGAEGLENRAQLAHLRRLDCEFGQGFYFSRPLESEAARELIASRPSWP